MRSLNGSAYFRDVRVQDDWVVDHRSDPPWLAADSRIFFHLYLQAIMVGIGHNALVDALQFVRSRTRSYGVPGRSEPRHEETVQTVIGHTASLIFAAHAAVRDTVAQLEELRARVGGPETVAEYSRVQVAQFMTQQVVINSIVEATNQIFEVGGASATARDRGLDRHWRNARTIASHNPAIFRKRAIGDYLLNGTPPSNTVVAHTK